MHTDALNEAVFLYTTSSTLPNILRSFVRIHQSRRAHTHTRQPAKQTDRQTKTLMCAMLIRWIFVCRLIVWLLTFRLNNVWTMRETVAHTSDAKCVCIRNGWLSGCWHCSGGLFQSCCYVAARFLWWWYVCFFPLFCNVIFGTDTDDTNGIYIRQNHTINIHRCAKSNRSKVVVHLIFVIICLWLLRFDLVPFFPSSSSSCSSSFSIFHKSKHWFEAYIFIIMPILHA